MEDLDLKVLGGRIQGIRTSKRATQDEMAEKTGLSVSTIKNMEAGRASYKLLDLVKLANYLEVPLKELIASNQDGGENDGLSSCSISKNIYFLEDSEPSLERVIPVLAPDESPDLPQAMPMYYVRPRPTLSSDSFGLEVTDDAMLPMYRPGDVVIVDPRAKLYSGCHAVVRLKKAKRSMLSIWNDMGEQILITTLNNSRDPIMVPKSEVQTVYPVVAYIWKSNLDRFEEDEIAGKPVIEETRDDDLLSGKLHQLSSRIDYMENSIVKLAELMKIFDRVQSIDPERRLKNT